MRSMEKARRRRLTGEGGFTLVELIVVIAILGILAAAVVFAVGGITNKGEQEANKTTCSVLQTAEEAYFAKFTSYVVDGGPQTAQQLLKAAGFLRTVDDVHFHLVAPIAPDTGYTIQGPNCS